MTDVEVYQQLGGVIASVRSIEVSTQKLDRRLDMLSRDLQHVVTTARTEDQKLANEIARLSTQVGLLTESVKNLREPVEQLEGLRNRVVSIGLAIGSIGTVAWFLAEPLWRFLAERFLNKLH